MRPENCYFWLTPGSLWAIPFDGKPKVGIASGNTLIKYVHLQDITTMVNHGICTTTLVKLEIKYFM